jgi:hypothetical protein
MGGLRGIRLDIAVPLSKLLLSLNRETRCQKR